MTHAAPEKYFRTLPYAEIERALRKGLGKHHPVATIAVNLRAEAEPHVNTNTVLRVVGNDLPNVADPAYPWTKQCLPDWLAMGITVKYFAVAPTEAAMKNLNSLANKFPGKLLAMRLDKGKALDNTANRCSQLWETYHFAAFENKPQLWVEMYHPPGVTEAKNCYYFAPGEAEELFLYEDSLNDFNHMFDNFGLSVIKAG